MTDKLAVRIDGQAYTSDANYSVSDYINISGHKYFVVTTTLWASNNRANSCPLAFYDANKTLVTVLEPWMFATATGAVSLTEQYFTVPDDVVYVRVNNYGSNTPHLWAVLEKPIIDRIQNLNTWFSGTGTNVTRKAINVYPILTTNKLRFYVKPKKGVQVALEAYDYVVKKNEYISGSGNLYDTGWMDELDGFSLDTTTYDVVSYQVRLFSDSFSASTTDKEVNDLLEYCYVRYEAPLLDDVVADINSIEILTTKFEAQKIVPSSYIMKSINHRGFNTIAPENTMPAFILSAQKRFTYIETDVQFTQDGVAVLLHDTTINRTARNADGTELSSTINVYDIDYTDLLTYDFGIWKGQEYAGTKMPTLAEFLAFCKAAAICPYLEIKNTVTTTQAAEVAQIVNYAGMKGFVTYIGYSDTLLGAIKTIEPKARLGVLATGNMNNSHVTKVNSLKSDQNEVFLDCNTVNAGNLTLCKNANIPFETWTLNTSSAILALDPYISGVTSDSLNAAEIMWYNLGL